MSTSNGGLTRTRISNRDVAFYEDNTARQLRIMNLVRSITLLVTTNGGRDEAHARSGRVYHR